MFVVERVELPLPIAHRASDKRLARVSIHCGEQVGLPRPPNPEVPTGRPANNPGAPLVQGAPWTFGSTPSDVSAMFSTCRCQNPQPLKSLMHPRGRQQTQESHGQGHREVSSVVPLLVWDSGRSRREPSAASLRAPGGGSEHHSTPSRGGAQECQ